MTESPLTPLSKLIRTRLERKGWSDMSLRELSAATDGRLSKDIIRLYKNGEHPRNPSESTLAQFAELLDASTRELREAAALSPGEDNMGQYVPPAESARLTRRQRLALDELIRSFVMPATGSATGGIQFTGEAHGKSRTVGAASHESSIDGQNVQIGYAKSGTVATDGPVEDDETVGSLAPVETDNPVPALASRPRRTGGRRRRASS